MVQLEILLPTKHYYCHFRCHIKCSKCPPLTCTHAFRRLVKSLTALLIGSCGMSSHINLQRGFQLGNRLWLRLQFVIPFQHGPPRVIVKGVEIWGIWWSTAFLNNLRTVCVQPFLRDTCRVCWSAILLENEPGWHQLPAVLDKLNFHSLYGYARIIAFAPHLCSRSVCIRILSACDTFPILTALTKCWLLTAIIIT